MGQITISDGDIEVPAGLIAEGLGVPVEQVQALMRAGTITSRCEHGVGEDAGRHRLTFFHRGLRLRFIVDSNGLVIRRMAIDVGDGPLSSALRHA